MRGRTFLPNSAGSKNCREFHIPGPPVSVCSIPTSLIADEKRQGRSCVGTEYVQTCLSLLFPKQLGMTTMHRAFETVCRRGLVQTLAPFFWRRPEYVGIWVSEGGY